MLAFDTETCPITKGQLAPPLVCISYADSETTHLVHHSEAQESITVLLQSDEKLIGHNVAFDFAVLAAKWPALLPSIFKKYERDQITDTLIREKLLDIAKGKKARYSLENLAKKYLNLQLDKHTWRLRYGELHDIPLAWWPEGAVKYALEDARTTYDIWQHQEQHKKYLEDQFRQARAAWWLHLLSVWGITTDPRAVAKLAWRLQTEYTITEKKLIKAKLVRSDGTRNTKNAQKYMRQTCLKKNLALVLTPTGKPKLDKDTCSSVGDPLLENYAKLSSLKKRLSTDIPLMQQGLIQPRFDTLLASGRTSSSPNIQNLPRKGGIRECYIPRKNYVFIAADYSTFELCAVAQVIISLLGIPSRLGNALLFGRDPHLELAQHILQLPLEEVARKYAQNDDDAINARQTAKVANFGFPGGLGIDRFIVHARKQYDVILTHAQARKLKIYWFTTWPEFQVYFKYISRLCQSGLSQVKQLFVNRYRGRCSYTEACNTGFQGLAADAAKHAGFHVSKACWADPKSPLYNSRIVNFVHDELILETPDTENASAAAYELGKIMTEKANEFFPDVPTKAEPYMMRYWSKNAKPIKNAEGKLIPWNG